MVLRCRSGAGGLESRRGSCSCRTSCASRTDARRAAQEILQKLRRWLDARDQQVVAGPGAGDVEQVPLGVVDLLRSASSPTASMRSCSGMTSSSQAMTATARNSRPLARCMVLMETWPPVGLDVLVEDLERQARCLDGRPGAVELRGRAHEHADLVRQRRPRSRAPRASRRRRRSPRPRVSSDADRRRRAVEHRDRVAPVLAVAVDVGDLGAEQAVGLLPDLVRGAVVDAQRARAAADVDAERLPGERLLEDALAEVAGEEQARSAGLPPRAARKRSWATPRSCASSTTTKSKGGAAVRSAMRAASAVNSSGSVISLRSSGRRGPARRSTRAPRAGFRQPRLPAEPGDVAVGLPGLAAARHRRPVPIRSAGTCG